MKFSSMNISKIPLEQKRSKTRKYIVLIKTANGIME